MIRLNQVKKNYQGFHLNVSMSIPSGSIIGLIGQNGAGKSTTFKILMDLINKDEGTIALFGKELVHLTKTDKEKIGVVLSDSGFSNYLTISDVIPIISILYANFDRQYFDSLISKFHLPTDKRIKDFSTGMKVKLKVIIAISHHPLLLILDEPTAGLDVVARDEVLDLLRDFMIGNEERSILISSHISSDLESLCDEIYMIDNGKIIFHEETDRILSDYALLKVDTETIKEDNLDPSYLLIKKNMNSITTYLTNQKQFYRENYPTIVVEDIGIDEVMTLIIKGERL